MQFGERIQRVAEAFAIEVTHLDAGMVFRLFGEAGAEALPALGEMGTIVARDPRLRVVIDFHGLAGLTREATATLAEVIREAHRPGKEVILVRCAAAFFAQLERCGLGGSVRHPGSLASATGGLMGDAETTLSLSVSSTPTHLKRIRLVLDRLAKRVPLGDEEVQKLQTAVGEACANAITHGSPQGPRNHVTVS